MNTLQVLFEKEIRDLYAAEKQLLEAFPLLINVYKDFSFEKGFKSFVEKPKHHFESLEHICKKLNIKSDDAVCSPINNLIKNFSIVHNKQISEIKKEIWFIISAQRVQLYKLSGYGAATRLARELGYEEVAELLQVILHREFYADNKLNALAIRKINGKVVC